MSVSKWSHSFSETVNAEKLPTVGVAIHFFSGNWGTACVFQQVGAVAYWEVAVLQERYEDCIISQSGLPDFWICCHLTCISWVEMVRAWLVAYVGRMGQKNSYGILAEKSLQIGRLKSRRVWK